MKKKIIFLALIVIRCLFGNVLMAQSVDPVSLILSKVIKNLDLKVQRLQNETLVLQRVQQEAEQDLAKNKLSEITGWQQQLARLYEGYYAELRQVKATIAGGSIVKSILALQQQLMTEYGRLGKDATVKPQYDRLLNNSMEILEALQMVTGSQLSMKDAERICAVQTLRDAMGHCLQSVLSLNRRQLELITNRTRLEADLDFVKRLHGL